MNHALQPTAFSRRAALQRSALGFGWLAASSLLADQPQTPNSKLETVANPSAAKQPHFAPRAKRVIFLFMKGGPSQVDPFDPKPLLNKLDGQKRPAEFGEAKYQFVQANATLRSEEHTSELQSH